MRTIIGRTCIVMDECARSPLHNLARYLHRSGRAAPRRRSDQSIRAKKEGRKDALAPAATKLAPGQRKTSERKKPFRIAIERKEGRS